MDNSIYLDIETSWKGYITIIGFYHQEIGLCQMIWPDITAERLEANLPPADFLFTYHGHCFDLPVISKHLKLSLRNYYNSIDLRIVCNRYNLYGGLKAVEKKLGIKRQLPDLTGIDAMNLWESFINSGSQEAIDNLLTYNQEDVVNLITLRQRLEDLGFSC